MQAGNVTVPPPPPPNPQECRTKCKSDAADKCMMNCKVPSCTNRCVVGKPGYKGAKDCTLCTSAGTASLTKCRTGCSMARTKEQMCIKSCMGTEIKIDEGPRK